MGVLETLSLAMGTAWAAGINVYATVAVLGLAGKYEMIQLPPRVTYPHGTSGDRRCLRDVFHRVLRR